MIVAYQDGINVPMPILLEGISADTIKYVNWSPDTWLNSADSLYAKFVPQSKDKELDYTLIVKTGKGTIPCETQANVKVINILPLVIPNAFSPNGDGVNDTWIIQGLPKYRNVTITVFNRWGNIVFNSNNAYIHWDRTINGFEVATGTYYAILELKGSPDKTDQNNTRSLTIVK